MQRSLTRFLLALVVSFVAIGPALSQSKEKIYNDLRSQLFETDPAKVGITSFTPKHGVFGVVMEMGYKRGTATLVALADGTTSLYLETGGGIIGGGQHHAVQITAVRLVNGADEFAEQLKKTTDYPLPERNRILFYYLTKNGTLKSDSAPEEDLAGGHHALSKLFYACHGLIARLRQVQQQ